VVADHDAMARRNADLLTEVLRLTNELQFKASESTQKDSKIQQQSTELQAAMIANERLQAVIEQLKAVQIQRDVDFERIKTVADQASAELRMQKAELEKVVKNNETLISELNVKSNELFQHKSKIIELTKRCQELEGLISYLSWHI
jgi:division protein CdvB (Snf7/Vps24/ESCRT-III family)